MSLTAILIAHFFALITPGPDMLYVAKSSVNSGFRATLPAIFGISAGISLWIVLVVFGFGFISQKLSIFNAILGVFGSIYLFYLGVKMLKSKSQTIELNAQKQSKRQFISGLMVNALNPKALLYFLSIFAPIISGLAAYKQAIIAACVIFESFASFALIAAAFRLAAVREFFRTKSVIVDRICGIIFILFSLGIAVFAYDEIVKSV